MDEEQFDRFYTGSYTKLVGQIYAMCGNLALFMDVWVVGGLGGWVWGLRGSASRGR